MKLNNKIAVALSLIFLNINLFAQTNSQYDFRNSGKVLVVYAVIFIILAVLFVYLFSMDRKVKKLEDRERKAD